MYSGPVPGLPERLRWITQHRGFGSMRALSLAADLSESHVGLIVRGVVQEGGVGTATLEKIARAARVDFRWLVTGEGSPDAAPPPAGPDRYPNRAAVIAFLQSEVPDAVLARVRAETPAFNADPPKRYWIRRVELVATELELGLKGPRGREVPADPGAPLPQAAVKPRPKRP